ncbi:rCG28033 [Rattus norvegicus]|uniref:RCG28033 n=1 Tax=Rattus norvegicus TaxID=10116 RepID=A6IDS6_RAT|nr:rCG28033 [Rattus norvegicus]
MLYTDRPPQKMLAGPEMRPWRRCSFSKPKVEENTYTELKNTWKCHL